MLDLSRVDLKTLVAHDALVAAEQNVTRAAPCCGYRATPPTSATSGCDEPSAGCPPIHHPVHPMGFGSVSTEELNCGCH